MATLLPLQRLSTTASMITVCLLVGACAVSPEKAAENLSEEERIVCVREVPTGSMGVRTMCRTVAEMRLQRDAVLRQMDEVRTEPTKSR